MVNSISLSVIVPCYNESARLESTVAEITNELTGKFNDYEIIIVEDCSTDSTLEIAQRCAKKYPHVRLHVNPVNCGLGYNYRTGYQLATKDYVILAPGDNELRAASITHICKHAGLADIILAYPENTHVRPKHRRITSRAFTSLMNWIGGKKIKYYNGHVLQRRENLLKIRNTTNGFAFQAEILLQMLQNGMSYYEVPFTLNHVDRPTTAFRPKNVVTVAATTLRLFATYRLGMTLTR